MDTTQPVGNVSAAYSAAGTRPTEEAARSLLAFISAGDRSALDRLYGLYFASLANFFLHLTAHADLVEELINDTMVEVWREGASIGANASVAVSIMRLAYSHGQTRVAKVEERALLHLVYVGGYSRRDVAAIMNISCECVDVLLSHARLRRSYAQRYVDGDSSR
jgi:DNA-directed RNA polymerase specialized sigma24 family protein